MLVLEPLCRLGVMRVRGSIIGTEGKPLHLGVQPNGITNRAAVCAPSVTGILEALSDCGVSMMLDGSVVVNGAKVLKTD